MERKKEWFIQKEIAELYKENNQLEKAYEYAIQAINNHGSLEYKIDLIFLLGELLKLRNENELSYKHFSLTKLIRANEEWSIPAKLVTALNQFDFTPIQPQQIESLKSELKKFWKSLQPKPIFSSPGRHVDSGPRLNGEILKILHNDERGADGFLVYNEHQSTYFKMNRDDRLKEVLAVGLKVTFELRASNGDKRERAVKLRGETEG